MVNLRLVTADGVATSIDITSGETLRDVQKRVRQLRHELGQGDGWPRLSSKGVLLGWDRHVEEFVSEDAHLDLAVIPASALAGEISEAQGQLLELDDGLHELAQQLVLFQTVVAPKDKTVDDPEQLSLFTSRFYNMVDAMSYDISQRWPYMDTLLVDLWLALLRFEDADCSAGSPMHELAVHFQQSLLESRLEALDERLGLLRIVGVRFLSRWSVHAANNYLDILQEYSFKLSVIQHGVLLPLLQSTWKDCSDNDVRDLGRNLSELLAAACTQDQLQMALQDLGLLAGRVPYPELTST
eukprot:TRINITY_DN18403_c0_g1_i2.p1 TRINITY_DN18403_c0_g1~~TRINITY_DN18403_c0_g1_i2.p1  ORF type:complete len:298 (-),score=42.59 TRINITY_DN18403_c0_g1_i2:1251-2144(-)